jgi:hypothetical protein
VGVARQYTGSAGKITNCQIGVSLSITTRLEQVPIDFELYLPASWIDDASRRSKVRIPPEAVFKTKTELALDMIDRAHAAGIPGNIVLADSAYGESIQFRETVRMLGFDYGVGIRSPTKLRTPGTGPLRGSFVHRMAPPRIRGPVLLRLHRCPAASVFSPLGCKARPNWYGPGIARHATSRTPSRLFALPLRDASPPGCHLAPHIDPAGHAILMLRSRVPCLEGRSGLPFPQ